MGSNAVMDHCLICVHTSSLLSAFRKRHKNVHGTFGSITSISAKGEKSETLNV